MKIKMVLSKDGQYAVCFTTTRLTGESRPYTHAVVHPVKHRKYFSDDDVDSIAYIDACCIDIGRCKNEKEAFQKTAQVMAERGVELDMKNIINDPPTIWRIGSLQ